MSSSSPSPESNAGVSREEFELVVVALRNENTELKRQLDWFKRQLFGSKSEKRLPDVNPHQMALGEGFETPSVGDDAGSKKRKRQSNYTLTNRHIPG